MRHASILLAATAAAVLAASAAEAAVGAWATGAKARVRLVAEQPAADGTVSGAIEIALPDGWKTYWRSPGDAGIPPTADFAASKNLGPVALAFPVPKRSDDGYTVTNVYEGGVVLPFTAKAADAGAPISVALSLDLGVCHDVCVPDHVEAKLDVPPGSDPAAAALITAARAKVPGSPEAGVLAVAKAVRQGGTDKRPLFDISLDVPDATSATVFVEGPSDWFPDQPKLISSDSGHAVYRVKFDRLTAKTPISGAGLRVTIVSGGRAVEQSVTLD